MEEKYCSYCGKPLVAGAKFCVFCGGERRTVKNPAIDLGADTEIRNDNRLKADQTWGSDQARESDQRQENDYPQECDQTGRSDQAQGSDQTQGSDHPQESDQRQRSDYPQGSDQRQENDQARQSEHPQGKNPDMRQGTPESKPGPGKMQIAAAAVIIVLLAVIVILLLKMMGKDQQTDSRVAAQSADAAQTDVETEYVVYTNETACFAIDYPEGYICTETGDTSVIFTEGEDADFQFHAEYAYSTADDCAIWSAGDFAELIEADETVLLNWLGTTQADIGDVSEETLAGLDCYIWEFELTIDDEDYLGEICLTDTEGAFGCYSLFWVINEEDEEADLYEEQCRQMAQSFQITDAYQAPGYTVYEFEECGIDLLLRDEGYEKTEEKDYGGTIYPVDGVFTEANIWIDSDPADTYDDTDSEVASKTSYYFTYVSDAAYASVAEEITIGRYDMTQTTLTYVSDSDGKDYTFCLYIIDAGDTHWYVKASATDEYFDETAEAVYDVLFSMRINGADDAGDGTADSGQDEDADDEPDDDAVDESVGESDEDADNDSDEDDDEAGSSGSESTGSLTISFDGDRKVFESEYYSISVDTDLTGEYIIEVDLPNSGNDLDTYALNFYHTDSMEPNGGFVFGIRLCSPDHDYTYMNEYEIAGELVTGGDWPIYYTVILVYPTDVQYTSDTEAGYREILAAVDDIMDTFTATDGGTYTEK